jgi:predicted dehydrogenase
MIVYDDLEPSEKLKIYDKGITVNDSVESVYKTLISYRTGDMWSPRLDPTEALRTEAEHFLECIEQGQRPLTDGEAGLRVVRILEAASQSMAERGRPVEVSSRP